MKEPGELRFILGSLSSLSLSCGYTSPPRPLIHPLPSGKRSATHQFKHTSTFRKRASVSCKQPRHIVTRESVSEIYGRTLEDTVLASSGSSSVSVGRELGLVAREVTIAGSAAQVVSARTLNVSQCDVQGVYSSHSQLGI